MQKQREISDHRKRLVLGVSGSIAAYKAPELVRYFIKRGYHVRVVMTESATKFIAPLTFEVLTGHPVACSFWSETTPGSIDHITLADWAQVVVVAPATADCIAKMAYGSAESSLLAVVLATKAPVVVAPAMNVNMYHHPQTQENLDTLRARGVQIVEPESGELACKWQGRGRLAANYQIYASTERALATPDLLGLRMLITAGPTREAVDPVRYLSNRSSGKMGIALAREAHRRGACVTLVHGPLSISPQLPAEVGIVAVESAQEMYQAVTDRVYGGRSECEFDVVIMAAAVSDYRPHQCAAHKIKKGAMSSGIELQANPDIAQSLGAQRQGRSTPFLVGFAVETGTQEQLIDEAKRKLQSKGLDMVVGNLASDSFDKDTNQVVIVSPTGAVSELEKAAKKRVAARILDEVSSRLSADGARYASLPQ